ncbi:unnamed protein product [Calypogeia fissa]
MQKSRVEVKCISIGLAGKCNTVIFRVFCLFERLGSLYPSKQISPTSSGIRRRISSLRPFPVLLLPLLQSSLLLLISSLRSTLSADASGSTQRRSHSGPTGMRNYVPEVTKIRTSGRRGCHRLLRKRKKTVPRGY